MSHERPQGRDAARYERVLARLRKICLALPDTSEVIAWGHPTFRVKDKIFVGFGPGDGSGGHIVLGFKTDGLEQQELVETEPAIYSVAKYVGKHGWVSMKLDGEVDWARVQQHATESYRLIAPKSKAGTKPAGPKSAGPRSSSPKPAGPKSKSRSKRASE